MNAHDEHPAAVDRMKQYIEDHLQDTITLRILAQAAGYSPWHAARMFKAHTGKTPFEYIRLRRLSSAARDLSTGSGRVTEVAFDFMFDSHEGFTRAFTRQFGLSPQRFKRVSPPVVMFLPPEMRFYFSSHRKGERSMDPSSKRQSIFVQVIERPARRLILKRGSKATHYFEYCEEVGCEVWEQLGSIEDALNEPMGLWLPASLRTPGTSEYVQGVEVPLDYAKPIPEGFDSIELAPCMLMVFQGPPFADENFGEAISSLWEEMDSYQPELYGFAWDEEAAPRFQFIPQGYRGYIEGRPVKRLNSRLNCDALS